MAFRELSGTPFSIFHILKQKSQFALRNHQQDVDHKDFNAVEKDSSITLLDKEENLGFRKLNQKAESATAELRHYEIELKHSDQSARNGEIISVDKEHEDEKLDVKSKEIRSLCSVSPRNPYLGHLSDFIHKSYTDNRNFEDCPVSDCSESGVPSTVDSTKLSSDRDYELLTTSPKKIDARTVRQSTDLAENRTESNMNKGNDTDEHSSDDNEQFLKYGRSQLASYRQHGVLHHPDLSRLLGNEEIHDDLKLHHYKFDFKPNLKLSESDTELPDGGKLTF